MATQSLGLEPKYIRLLPKQEKELFREFVQIGKGEGRVYKQKVGDHYCYFRAQGFFKSIWHFFFTERLDIADLERLYSGVTAKIDLKKDEEVVKRVSAAFFSVVCLVVNKNPMFGAEEIGILLTKQKDTVSACQRSTKPLSPIEISLLKHVAKVREYRDVKNYGLCRREENFRVEYSSLFRRAKDMLSTMSPDDIPRLGELSEKLRAKASLTHDELALGVRAKELYYDVKNSIGARLDIEKLSQIKPELSLFQSLNIQSEDVDLILSQKKQAMKQKMDALSLDELTIGYFDTDEEAKVKSLFNGAMFRYGNKYIKICVGDGWLGGVQEWPSVRFYELQVTENGKLKLLNHTAYRLIVKPEDTDAMRYIGHFTTNQSFISSSLAVTIESKIHSYSQRVFAALDDK